MDHVKFSEFLGSLETNNCLFLFEPEILDFTEKKKEEIKLHIHATGGLSYTLEIEKVDDLERVAQSLTYSLFAKGSRVITWNWKNFASYVLGKTKKPLVCECAIIDLKIIESYLGLKSAVPKTLGEALGRMKKVMAEPNYKKSSVIYRNIHLPLMTTV